MRREKLEGYLGMSGGIRDFIPSVFHAASTLSAPSGHLPLEGKAIKLSGRTFLAPHRGSCPKGEARRYVANDFLNLIAFPSRGRCPEGADRAEAV